MISRRVVGDELWYRHRYAYQFLRWLFWDPGLWRLNEHGWGRGRRTDGERG